MLHILYILLIEVNRVNITVNGNSLEEVLSF